MPPKVDIIILNFNGLTHLKPCLASLYKHTSQNFHLIVVDNVSTDGSREWLTSFSEKVNNITLHFNEKPDGGYAEGNNIGLQYAKHKYVLLLNNDTLIIEKGWLKRIVQEMKQNPKVGIIGVKLVYPNDLIQHAGVTFGCEMGTNQMRPFHIGRMFSRERPEPFHIGRMFSRERPEFNIQREVPAVTFACVLIRHELLKNGLDETYERGCFEDVDFCLKVRKQGYKILYVPVELYHYEGATNLPKPNWMSYVAKNFQIFLEPNWMSYVAKNFQIFLDRWNEWLKRDFEENQDLYDPRGPVKNLT